ncbi:MAG: class A beta-lactamase, subclass A2 [Gammaproteobacteria bacterium]|nr:class A beta-lactamase, subclass A2 [Gammaproteobacteria bacterium]MBU2057968.1 class A beta-lactamase, subclass A2 [Gammaproteobacteria bacterium]MBU2174320.1 class A beta-lactamase, subclass A2 [Gammaproteobacteria bacterium]MBU2247729.1 class A beta-lactamase, subclass A2 [Gammaproteobacteria bacterium]MBU2344255.1 class A beta-lactamase, subclass A2 [Gammaproteobacteria bacterium]
MNLITKSVLKATAVLILTLSSFVISAQSPLLKEHIETIVTGKKATVGVAVWGPDDLEPLLVNPFEKFPMQSVFKLHLALLVLHQVDQGKLELSQLVAVKRAEVLQNTWAPMMKDYQGDEFRVTIEQLLQYSVSHSDNVACDLLFELIGGPAALQAYIQSLGIAETEVVANEAQMHADDQVQYQNWTSMKAAARILKKFEQKELLSETSQALLWKWMVETTTGPARLKGLLPATTVVAHKTGTSGVRVGKTAATNDIGVIMLPDGRPLLVAVFVKDSAESNKTNEAIIAQVAQAAYQFELKKLSAVSPN